MEFRNAEFIVQEILTALECLMSWWTPIRKVNLKQQERNTYSVIYFLKQRTALSSGWDYTVLIRLCGMIEQVLKYFCPEEFQVIFFLSR